MRTKERIRRKNNPHTLSLLHTFTRYVLLLGLSVSLVVVVVVVVG